MSPEIATAASNLSRISSNSSNYKRCKSSFGNSNGYLSVSSSRKEIIEVTRKHYHENFEEFLLNNIVMAVVPFDNYEEDLKIYGSKTSSHEQELNQLNEQFEKRYCKRLIFPDSFFENANKHIVFQRRCDKTATSLIPQRIFVVDKLIEINEESAERYDQNNNENDNDPTDKVNLVPSKSNLGFVKLQNRIYRKSTVSSTASWNSCGRNRISLDRSHRSSSSTVSSGESRWAVKEPLWQLDPDLGKRSMYKRVRNENYPISSSTISTDSMGKQVHRHDEYMLTRNYTDDFVEQFIDTISMHLGLDSRMFKLSKTRLIILGESCSVNYEVSPALDVNWPDKLTTHWFLRNRNEMINSNSNQPLTWPSEDVRKDLGLGQCVIVPRHSGPADGTFHDNDGDVEWEISFPRAEKYLQTTMTHAQTKTYFFLALIYRSFIEPLTKQSGVLLEHFRMYFYWELEKRYVSFPETRMGSKIIDILDAMYFKLGDRKLKHYFYGPDKNVLDNIPNNGITTAQDQINKIRNNKVGYFIAALSNLRYTSNDSFPQFDFKKFHQLLTEDHLVSKPMSKLHGFKLNLHKTKPQEWIDLKVPCKVNSNETIRKLRSLKIFIEHFLEVGRVCFVKSRRQLGRMYYLQARDLTTILAEEGHHATDVNMYKESIRVACPDL